MFFRKLKRYEYWGCLTLAVKLFGQQAAILENWVTFSHLVWLLLVATPRGQCRDLNSLSMSGKCRLYKSLEIVMLADD